jgi:integrase
MREYEQARIKERISPEVAERLKLWFEEREEALGRKLSLDEPLLLTAKGDRLTRGGLSDYMISIGRAARIKRFEVTSHVFRHTKNVIRRLAGLDSLQRSALLGHTNPGSLTAYEKLMPQELVGARQRETEGLAAYLADTDEGDYDDGISGMRALPPSPVSKPVKKLKG